MNTFYFAARYNKANMASLNLDTNKLNLNNKSIIFEGNSPITDSHKEILKNYEVLYICHNFNQSLDGLPNNIKAIRYNMTNSGMRIRACSCTTMNVANMEFDFNQPLDNLHYGLEYLELYGNNVFELRNLPISLKYLVIYWSTTNIDILKYLPESLEVLYLSYIELHYEGIINLPRGLKELYLNAGINGRLQDLPDGLKVLYINGSYTQLNKFIELPPRLETFIFYDSEWQNENKHIIKWLFKNKKMPTGLRKCVFPLHYADIYCELKIYAAEFITSEKIEWKFIDYTTDLISHIKDKYK